MARMRTLLIVCATALVILILFLPRIWLPRDIQIRMGRAAAEKVLQDMPPAKNVRGTLYVQALGQHIARAADDPTYEYRFFLVESDTFNAFALPDGSIFITTELLKRMASRENALMGVLAHEIGHVARGHGAEHIQSALGWTSLTLMVFGIARPATQGALNLSANIVENGYGREMELEADLCALRYLVRLGIDPDDAQEFLRLLPANDSKDDALARFLRTHPKKNERQDAARSYARKTWPQ